MKHKLKNAPPDTKRHVNYGRCLYAAFLAVTVLCGYTQPVFAATIWTKANEIMKDVYNQIILISTIAAVVTASVALLMMNFSKSGKTVDESRAWLKRIVITWDLKRAWLYHGLHHPVLCRRKMERIDERRCHYGNT